MWTIKTFPGGGTTTFVGGTAISGGGTPKNTGGGTALRLNLITGLTLTVSMGDVVVDREWFWSTSDSSARCFCQLKHLLAQSYDAALIEKLQNV